MKKKEIYLTGLTALLLSCLAFGCKSTNGETKIKITVGNTVLTGVLFNNELANDFKKELPIELNMADWLGREKYGRSDVFKSFPSDGDHQRTFKAGDIGYWPGQPARDITVFYQTVDTARTPEPGIIMIGRIDAGVEIFANNGDSVTVKFEKLE